MAGHNKWTQIKRQKGANDAARSAIFGKLARRITVEARLAHGNTDSVSLKSAIEKARMANMPKENIERAIEKATSSAEHVETVLYEGYGPGGSALVIQTVTDNRNRTLQDLKALCAKNPLVLATPGSALWAFEKTVDGYIPLSTIALSPEDDAELMKLLGLIDALDDVEDVFTNAE